MIRQAMEREAMKHSHAQRIDVWVRTLLDALTAAENEVERLKVKLETSQALCLNRGNMIIDLWDEVARLRAESGRRRVA